MNQSMREFTTDIEKKLDHAYKSGASKKYGYESISNLSRLSSAAQDEEREKKESKVMAKIQNQAQTFLDKQAIAGTTKNAIMQGK